jgi:hypothetical protein
LPPLSYWDFHLLRFLYHVLAPPSIWRPRKSGG